MYQSKSQNTEKAATIAAGKKYRQRKNDYLGMRYKKFNDKTHTHTYIYIYNFSPFYFFLSGAHNTRGGNTDDSSNKIQVIELRRGHLALACLRHHYGKNKGEDGAGHAIYMKNRFDNDWYRLHEAEYYSES